MSGHAPFLVTASGSVLDLSELQPHFHKGVMIPPPQLLEDCMKVGVQSTEQSVKHIVCAHIKESKNLVLTSRSGSTSLRLSVSFPGKQPPGKEARNVLKCEGGLKGHGAAW